MLPAAPQNEKKTEIIYIFKSKTQLLHKVKTGSSKTKEEGSRKREAEKQIKPINEEALRARVRELEEAPKPETELETV